MERTSQAFMLTAPGAIITERARKILTQIEEMREMARLTKDPYSGDFKIGIFPTLAPYLLPHIIPQLKKTFPKITLYLIEEKTPLLLEKLEQGQLDTAILAIPTSQNNFSVTPLFEEEFMLAVRIQHPFAKRKAIKQIDLANKSLLLLDEGHCLREQALALCNRVHAEETKDFRATSLETLRHMVAANVGMTLMPKLACKPCKDVCYITFNSPKPIRTTGMVWRHSSAKKILLEEVANNIKKSVSSKKIWET